jgi:putative nucleotidyltransferase with HDIG domain
MSKASLGMSELIKRLRDNKIERISFERGIAAEETAAFIHAVAALGKNAAADAAWSFPHIRVGRIVTEDRPSDGISGDIAAIRQLYSKAVTAAEATWESAATEGQPDLPGALQAVEGLADAVTQNRTALVALTAMRNYDNYTFTHMVNVSILTMGQARALGIEGRLLREFGLSALMHDIGKVRTPKEVLNKPDKLTEAEFEIMRRHTVDGAEILRRTPEMPILAPVVAFEHHLRMDGTGYPFGAKRAQLNLGTMMCGIADVYDAMRSQRSYQQAFPTDRILAVLKRNDGTQFDQNLVRRFVQLLGVYPPGNMVRLSSGEIAVVTQVHAPDPHRPRVRVLINAEGARLELPYDRNLWEAGPTGEQASIAAPVEPAVYGIDPLTYLQN